MQKQREGEELRGWLNSPVWRRLPDFLAIPKGATDGRLHKSDILVLRALAANPGQNIPTRHLAGIVRLHAHGIIDRRETEGGAKYFLSAYSHEVLRHNVSYRG